MVNTMLKKLDGYKIYITALIAFFTGLGSVVNTLTTGEGNLMDGVQMMLGSMTIAGFRSTANKIIDGKK